MTDHATNNDTETLKQWLWEHEHGHVSSNNPGGHLCSRSCLAGALMRSRWRRDRDAGVAAQAKAEALREAALIVSGAGSHRDPCRLPDTGCLCGLCDFRSSASRALRAAVAVPEPEEETQ